LLELLVREQPGRQQQIPEPGHRASIYATVTSLQR
jgi:hypothetical protein